MILVDDNFATIVDALRQGHGGLYANIVKFAQFQLSTAWGFVLIFVATGLLGATDGAPFSAMHVLKGGSRIAEHHANESASIQTISGHLRLHLPDQIVEVPVGQLLALGSGLRHDVEASVDSAFVLTLGWRG